MRLLFLSLLMGAAACTPVPPSSDDVRASSALGEINRAPMEFLIELYKHYEGEHGFSPMGDAASQFFDAVMVALIREDSRLRGNEIGALDHDPVCQCQDYTQLHVQYRALEATDTAARIVSYIWEKAELQTTMPHEVTFDLVRVDGQWRINDLSTKQMPSLRVLLAASNSELAKGSLPAT